MTYSEQTAWLWCFWLAVLATCAALTINTIATDNGGSDPEDHQGPVPAGVAQLSPQAYLIEPDSNVVPGQICKGTGGSSNASPIESVADVKSLHHATYAHCYADQHWNRPYKKSPNFGDAMISTGTNKWFFGPVLIVALALALWAAALILPRNYHAKKQAKENAKMLYDKQLAQYRALQSSWSKDEIDDLQFDKKIQALVAQGFEVPDEGVFKT
jgi:hypothetical protein